MLRKAPHRVARFTEILVNKEITDLTKKALNAASKPEEDIAGGAAVFEAMGAGATAADLKAMRLRPPQQAGTADASAGGLGGPTALAPYPAAPYEQFGAALQPGMDADESVPEWPADESMLPQ